MNRIIDKPLEERKMDMMIAMKAVADACDNFTDYECQQSYCPFDMICFHTPTLPMNWDIDVERGEDND